MLVSLVASARARAREMLFNSWDKNDRKDTNVILYLLEQGMAKAFHDPLSKSEWLCRILLKFPTPHVIKKMRKQTFVRRAWDVVGRKVNKQRFLEELYEVAEQSVGLPVDVNSVAILTFKSQVQRYLELIQQGAQLEKYADQF